jgi:hypothetical protein
MSDNFHFGLEHTCQIMTGTNWPTFVELVIDILILDVTLLLCILIYCLQQLTKICNVVATLAVVYCFIHNISALSRILEKLIVTHLLKKLPTFMGPEGSLPCSQQPATSLYSKPDESNPQLPTVLL